MDGLENDSVTMISVAMAIRGRCVAPFLPGVEFGTRGSLSELFPAVLQAFFKREFSVAVIIESMKMDHCADRGSGAGKRGKFSLN